MKNDRIDAQQGAFSLFSTPKVKNADRPAGQHFQFPDKLTIFLIIVPGAN